MSSASVRCTISVLYCAQFCMKCSLGISNFLEEISSLSHSVVFLYFFALITEEGFRVSLLALLWNSAFRWVYLSFSPLLFASLLFSGIHRPPQTAILLFCISFCSGWSWSLSPVQCLYYLKKKSLHYFVGFIGERNSEKYMFHFWYLVQTLEQICFTWR